MNILIAGSSGQLAKEFIVYFQKNNINFFAPSEQDFNITDIEKIKNTVNLYKPDIIINCAAYNNVELAETDTEKANLINKTAVSYLTEISEKNNIKFVHFGTDYIFDGTKNDFYTEEDIPNPLNEYGKSKLSGEKEALKYGNSLVLRLSWVIGNGRQNFLYKLSNWLKSNQSLNISCDEVSVPCFTFDIVKYTMTALKNNLKGIYQLTNSQKASRYELAKLFAEVMNYTNQIKPVPMNSFPSKVKRPLFTAMSNKKISKELNITIPSWKDSLKIFCNNIKNNDYRQF